MHENSVTQKYQPTNLINKSNLQESTETLSGRVYIRILFSSPKEDDLQKRLNQSIEQVN